MEYYECLRKIIEFNGDKKVIALRERFNKVTFFEMISKERSETIYSSFLRWLFQESGDNSETCNPVAMLLDVLVRRYEEQQKYIVAILKDENVKRSIVTRNLKIQSVKVETEKAVSNLAQDIVSDLNKQGKLSDDELLKIAANSQDRIDLFIDCEIESVDNAISAQKLQIILENKIDSVEGGIKGESKTGVKEYDDAPQTTRYFLGSRFSGLDDGKPIDGKDTLQLYVYLTALSSDELSNYGELKKIQEEYDEENKKRKKRKRVVCADDNYIQINYQDIVDGILMPMLASSSLSSRSRFFLEEFLNQLVFPSLDGAYMRPSIAIGQEYSEELSELWSKYKELLIPAAIAASESDFWKIGDTYYDHQPRQELLRMLLEKGIKHDIIINNQWKKNVHYPRIKELATTEGITTEQVNLILNDELQDLLSSFWDKNKRLLTAWMNGMDADNRKKVEGLLSQASKRDTTKYNIYYDNVKQNEKPLGNGQAAFSIVKLWVKEQIAKNKEVTFETLNDKFPLSCNPYYAKSQVFEHLFYEFKDDGTYTYDGKKGNKNPVVGNWDFDKKGNFNLETSDGKIITMLKMWRKDALDALKDHIEKKKLFNNSVAVREAAAN